MPRMARLVVPGFPHHVTQRGVRGQRTFFEDADYGVYLELLREFRERSNVGIWAYCLMPNHIHVIAVPNDDGGLARLFRMVHGEYARKTNSDHEWQGHLWQQRYYSAVMDEAHTLAAMRYVELNPVRAGLCDRPQDWRWSSVHAHLDTGRDEIVDVSTTREIVGDWISYLAAADDDMQDSLRHHTRTGRPAGDDDFVEMLEVITGKEIRRRRPRSAET